MPATNLNISEVSVWVVKLLKNDPSKLVCQAFDVGFPTLTLYAFIDWDTLNAYFSVPPDPVIWEFTFTLNPSVDDIDAVAVPEVILSKSNPTIPVEGIFVNPEPSPTYEPENEPLKIPSPESAKSALLAWEDETSFNISTEDDTAYDALVAKNTVIEDVWAFNTYEEVFAVKSVMLVLFIVSLELILSLTSVNDPDISVAVNTGLLSNVVTRELNDADGLMKAPLISVAIWADPDNKPDFNVAPDSIFAILVAIDDDKSAVEPLISEAIWLDPDINVLEVISSLDFTLSESDELTVVIVSDIDALVLVNDPLISEAIWLDPDINVFAITNSLAVILALNELLSCIKFGAIISPLALIPADAVMLVKLDTCSNVTWSPTLIGENPSNLENEPVLAFTLLALTNPVVSISPDPDNSNEPVITAEPENGNPTPAPPPAFKANDAVKAEIACEAVTAYEALMTPANPDPSPENDPVTPPSDNKKSTVPDPETNTDPVTISPSALSNDPGSPLSPLGPCNPLPPWGPGVWIDIVGLGCCCTVILLPVLLFVMVRVNVGCDMLISLIFLVTDVAIFLNSCYLFI